MHGYRALWLDRVMLLFTQIGSSFFILIVAAVLLLRKRYFYALELSLGALTLGLVVGLFKASIRRTRPFLKLRSIRIIGSRASGHSFPSGHTSQTFFMATLLLHYYQANLAVWILLYMVASLVGITRVYLGMHYPRDVLAGVMLGTAWGLLSVIINQNIFGS